MAAFHGDGRVLPKWSVANVAWVVRPALPALVSCDDGIRHARTRAGPGVDAFSAEAVANSLLFHRDAVADRDHPDGQLHISELSCSGARFSAFGRPLPGAVPTAKLEESGSRTGEGNS